MFFYFRQLRRHLLFSKKTRKYILYALGEIALVVIGIYIAFQIDAYKEESKSEENTRILLHLIMDNLEQDIGQADSMMEYWGELRDYAETYFNIRELRDEIVVFKHPNFIQARYFLDPSSQGYEVLSEKLTDVDPRLRSILSRLTILYTDNRIIMDTYRAELRSIRKEGWLYLSMNDSTYSEFQTVKDWKVESFLPKKDFISIHDWRYGNLVALYEDKVEDYLWEVASWRQSAYINYIYIYDYLYPEEPLPAIIPSSEIKVPTQELDKIIGCYQFTDLSLIRISKIRNYLVLRGSDHIYWLFGKLEGDKWESFTYDPKEINIVRDISGEIIGIRGINNTDDFYPKWECP